MPATSPPPGLPPWSGEYAARLTRYVLARDGGVCHWCGRRATTADHKVPRSAGGTDDPANLVACCRPCNSSKGVGVRPARARPSPPSRVW